MPDTKLMPWSQQNFKIVRVLESSRPASLCSVCKGWDEKVSSDLWFSLFGVRWLTCSLFTCLIVLMPLTEMECNAVSEEVN